MLQANRNSPQPSDDAGESTLVDTFGGLVSVIRRQLPVFVIFLCCSYFLGFLYLFTAPRHYTAAADMVIDTRKVQVFQQQQSIVGDNNVGDSGTVQTEIEVIKSSKVIESVINDLHLLDDPEFTGEPSGFIPALAKLIFGEPPRQASNQDLMRLAVARFSANLTVGRVGTTYVISIGFRSSDPAKAVRISNAVADAYILNELDAKYQVTRRAGVWLQSRIAELRTEASAAERAVVDFDKKNNIVGAGGRLMNEQQLSELNSQLILAHTSTAEAKARLERVEEVMRQPLQDASVADALNNQIIIKLRSQYLELAGQEAIWSRKYGPGHLAVVNLRTQMQELARNIYDEMTKIAESYKSDFAIALAREQALQKSLADSVADTESTNQAQVEARELESNAKTYQTLYDNFLQRYMEAIQQESFPISEARVITPATLPFSPSDPKALLVLLITGAGGLLLSIGVAAARESTDRAFRESSQIENVLHMNCLATLPLIKPDYGKAPDEREDLTAPTSQPAFVKDDDPFLRYSVDCPFSQFTEALRSVKVAVDLNGILQKKKILGFTSSFPNEGKTTVSTNFARLLAHSGSRTILIDADLRNPSLSRHLAPNAKFGLVDILADRCLETDAQVGDRETPLIFIPSGPSSKIIHSAELLGSDKMKKLVERLNDSFDYVILDLAPLTPIVDVRMTTSFIDSYVFVVEWGRTHIRAVEHATHAAREVHDRILGVVLNKANSRLLARYDSYRGLSYGRKYYSRYGYID